MPYTATSEEPQETPDTRPEGAERPPKTALPLPESPELPPETTAAPSLPPAVTVSPGDPRYDHLVRRSRNTRFVGAPDSVHLVHSADQVRQVVQDAIDAGRRIAVRSGGHGLENLVDDPAVRTLVDMSRVNTVGYDPRYRAFGIGAGALLGQIYPALYLSWGVAIPGGTCPTVGLGGYVQGGGFGAMCRGHGLIVDHLYGVEMVVVDESGRARTVVATREPSDPHRDLWWACTGAGGGNFGIATRFWFRSPEADAEADADRLADPSLLLPRPPRTIITASVAWPWETMTERAFTRIVHNHGEWHRRDGAEGPGPYDTLYSGLYLNQRMVGQVTLNVQMDGGRPDSRRLIDEYIAAVNDGVDAPYTVSHATMPWLDSALRDVENRGIHTRSKSKGAYLRQPYTAEQAAIAYRYLSEPGYNGHTVLLLFSYGGKINTVDPSATAAPQRDSILKSYLGTYWVNADEDQRHLDRVRAFYAELYAATGGVPAPGTASDGSYINYPDTDLTDPELNTSGIPWHTLYFKDGYERLQRAKARWDPRDVFRHALSIRLP
jgi:aclacinomycin oxidase